MTHNALNREPDNRGGALGDPVYEEIADKLRLPSKRPVAAKRAAPARRAPDRPVAVDIHLPLRDGGFVPGRVVAMFLTQQVPISLYVEPGPDLTFSARDDQLLTLVAPTAQEVSRIKHTTKIAHKRNRLLVRGDSPYVYLADADVSFEKHPFLPGMIRGMTDHPQLGMVGLCYQDTPHVACGSMLVRRQDIEAIGAIRDTASWCACMFLGRQIKEMGLRVVPLERSRATELDLAELGGQPVPDVHLAVASDGAVPRRSLEALLQQHGTRFRLFVSVRAGAR